MEEDVKGKLWGWAICISSYEGVVVVWIWQLDVIEYGVCVCGGIGGGGSDSNEAAGGKGVVNEAGFEHLGVSLVELGDGSGHLCEGDNW